MQKHTICLVTYLALVHLALAGVIFKFDVVQRLVEKVGLSESKHAQHFRKMMAFHRRIDACVPEDAVLFVGDSFIQSMCVSAVINRAVNFGIGGDTTAGVLKRLPEYTSIKKAKAVVLEVGYNDLRERENDEILQNYRYIIKLIPPSTPVLFCSVLPTDERSRQERYNERIDRLNCGIAEVCSMMDNCYFVDIASDLKDREGNLSSDYHEGDGIHLNIDGYEIFSQKLRPYFMRIRGTKALRR